jgi:hypothetical protein
MLYEIKYNFGLIAMTSDYSKMKSSSCIHEKQLKQVGTVLKELRLKKGYSSAENFSYDFELNRSNYWRWENGRNITLKNIFKICEIHQISVKDFFELIEASSNGGGEVNEP